MLAPRLFKIARPKTVVALAAAVVALGGGERCWHSSATEPTRYRSRALPMVSPGQESRRDRTRRRELAKRLVSEDRALLRAQRRAASEALAAVDPV